MKLNKLFPATLCLTLIASPNFGFANESNGVEAQIRASLNRASKAVNLPNAKSVAVFGDNESVVLTDNPRWVVKGQLYDMWDNKEINSQADLVAAAKVIPINTINVNTTDIIDIRVRPEKSSILTVFLDPFSEQSANEMYLLNKYASEYQVRYIFTAMSQANIKPFFNFACSTTTISTEEIVDMVINKRFSNTDRSCRVEQAMNSFGLTQFLHINKSPTLIAPNNVFHAGMPVQLMDWLKTNTL